MSVRLKKQSFIEQVNRWAIRHNAPTVNARMLEDWNEKAIFPPAVAIQIEPGKVPEWHFGRQHYRRALIICRLKRGGIERYSAIRVVLWLIRMEQLPPIEDLIDEYERVAKQLVAGISSAFDPGISGLVGKKAE